MVIDYCRFNFFAGKFKFNSRPELVGNLAGDFNFNGFVPDEKERR